MSSKLLPPVFNKSYEFYKSQLEAWELVTDVADEKRGIYIALSLPDNHESKIKEKVFEGIKNNDLNKKGGLTTLIAFLDKHLLKDSSEDRWQKFQQFEDFSKSESETVQSYIATFDQKYERCKTLGMVLPGDVLALKLLKGANLSNEERLLVMTGISFDDATKMYDAAKKSLLKFKGGVASNSSGGSSPAIKLEPAFYASTSQRGWRSKGSYQPNTSHRGSYQPNASNTGNRGSYQAYSNSRGRSSFSPREKAEKDLNPMGRDGKIMRCPKCESIRHLYKFCPDKGSAKPNPTGRDGRRARCDSCESTYHFIAKCPHKWPDSEHVLECVVSQAEEDNQMPESEFLDDCEGLDDMTTDFSDFTFLVGCPAPEISDLIKETDGRGLLDTGCGALEPIGGRFWFDEYLKTLDLEDKNKVLNSKRSSSKTFRFGDDRKLKSLGRYRVPLVFGTKVIEVDLDIVDSHLPLLVTCPMIISLGGIINTQNDTITLLDEEIPMALCSSNMYTIAIKGMTSDVFAAVSLNEVSDDECKERLLKLHRQFGHPSNDKLRKLLEDAQVWEKSYARFLDEIHSKCKVCKEYSHTPPRPVVSLPMAHFFNDVVSMDLKHWHDGLWILYIVDLFTRYTMGHLITRKKPEVIVETLIKRWISIFGVMGKIHTDNGGEFNANEVREVASILDFSCSTTGAESPWQNGVCERVHAVTDVILTKLVATYPKTPLDVLLAWACMAKNTLQMNNGFSANQLVFGQNPKLPNIMSSKLPGLSESTTSVILARHLNALHSARIEFVKSESDERIRRALRSKVRASEQVYKPKDKVYYKREGFKEWLGPGSVIGQEGKVIFVRHGGQVVRVSANRLVKANDVDFGNQDSLKLYGSGAEASSVSADSCENSQNSGVVPQETFSECIDTPATVAHPRINEPERRSLRVFNQEQNLNGEQRVYLVTIPRSRHNEPDCIAAKQTELKKLEDFDVYEKVPYFDQDLISTRWVLWEKGDEIRARLVARGFEEQSNDCSVDSPTVGKVIIRIVLIIAVAMKWVVQSTDIKSAFLQGMPLSREVYIKPPKEALISDDMVWKLKKCLYGLNDAARQFYDSVRAELLRLGCKTSQLDPSLFFYQNDSGILQGVIVSHIDDFLHAGSQIFYDNIMDPLCQRFKVGSHHSESFKYVGYQINQQSNGVRINQEKYIENAEIPEMSPARCVKKSNPLNEVEITQYRALVGMLNWIVQTTRPDLYFDLIDLSTKFKSSTVEDLIRVHKILIKVKNEKSEIFIPNLGNDFGAWRLIAFTDASLGNLNSGTNSCGGSIIFLSHGDLVAPLVWRSGRIKRVVRATLSAEALSLCEGLDEAIYVKHILCEILSLDRCSFIPIIGITDHDGLQKSVKSTKLVDDRRLRMDIAALKENIEQGIVQDVRFTPSGDQLADVLTKKGVNGSKLLSVLQTGKLVLNF